MWCSGGHHVAIPSVNTVNARSIGAATTSDVRTDVVSVLGAHGLSCLCFDGGLEAREGPVPEPIEVVSQRGDPVRVHR